MKQDRETARKLFELAANKGHDGAQAMLGKMYDDDKDYARAKEWYTIAAASGNSSALNNLGMLYYHGKGYRGTTKRPSS